IPIAYQLGKLPTPDLTAGERNVLGVYVAHSDPRTDPAYAGRDAYPSARTIAEILDRSGKPSEELDTAPVKRARARLVELGYLISAGENIPIIDGRPRPDKATPRFTVAIPERGDRGITPDSTSGVR